MSWGTTARALGAPTSAGEVLGARLGTPWLAQAACWRCSARAPRRQRQRQPARAALLDPPPFDPSKLSVEYLPGGREAALGRGLRRRYTLTHNDVTGSLQLSIGREYNRRQLDGWYTRILRDEILAEWQETAPPRGGACGGGGGEAPPRAPRSSLHVFCHVSGEELWPAPPQLRSFIFQREMALVLDTIAHAEGGAGGLLAAAPHLRGAPVYVHLRSDIPALDRVVEWGVLGDRSSWRTAQSTVMASLLSSVLGTLDEADATDGSNGTWSRSSFSTASASWDEAGCAAAGWGGEGAAGGDACSQGAAEQPQQAAPPPQQQPPQRPQTAAQQQPSSSLAAGAQPPLADTSSSLSNGSTGSAGTNGAGTNGAIPMVPSSSSSSAGGAVNGAVSLAAAQQAERAAWLSVPPPGDSAQRLPAVEVVATRQR